MRVYFCSSSGTGKTTLANHVASRYGLRPLPSAARQVFAGFGYASFEALMARPEAYEEFQTAVARRQAELEDEFGEDFVSDRCVDHFAFRAIYGSGSYRAYRSDHAERYLHGLRRRSQDGSSLVFFVPPSKMVNAAARADPQGRGEYLGWDDCNRFAGAVKFILESAGIAYSTVACEDLNERFAFVDGKIDALVGLPGAV